NHAMTVILAAHVASTTTGTPTGDVSFNAPQGTPNAAIGFLTLDASGNTIEPNPNPGTKIPGGAYTLKAHYGGDQTFAQSDDATGVPVTVDKENSGVLAELVTFDPLTGNITNTNAATFAFGSPYILRIDIENSIGTATTCQPLLNGGNLNGCAFD